MFSIRSIDWTNPRSKRIVIVCLLLLLASAVNYMDRQTLAVASARIKSEFQLENVQYGRVEAIFGYSFAFGSLFWGFIVDRFSVRWVYPLGLLGWSAMGFLTGWANNYDELYWCRLMLGFFESAHWPCGLKTTQALLSQQGRAMGNSVLQSGTSIGAILTPIVMLSILTSEPGSWRIGFQGIAVVGALWVFLWLYVVRDSDLIAVDPQPTTAQLTTAQPNSFENPPKNDAPLPENTSSNTRAPFNPYTPPGNAIQFGATPGNYGVEHRWWHDVFTRRFAIVLLMVMCINTMWQVMRAWLPLIMQENYGFNEKQTLVFNSIWYIFTDIGCFASGVIASGMAGRGWSIVGSRLLSLTLCVILFATLIAVPFLNAQLPESTSTVGASTPVESPSSPSSTVGLFTQFLSLDPLRLTMLGVLLISGAGALGIFPIYYSFAQDVSPRHQGKVTSIAATGGWLASSYAQPWFGWLEQRTGSYDLGIFLLSVLPILPLACLYYFWPREPDARQGRSPNPSQ